MQFLQLLFHIQLALRIKRLRAALVGFDKICLQSVSIDRGRTRINITAYTSSLGRPSDRRAAFEIDLPRQIGIDLSGEIIAETGEVDDAVDAFEQLRIEMPSVLHDEFEQWVGR